MADNTDEDIVTFEDSEGNEISNDPRWHARRILGENPHGVDNTELAAENERLRAQLAALNSTPNEDDEVDDDDEEDEDTPRDYTDLTGPALAKYAKERGITTKREDGSKKTVGDVRAELIELDKANAGE